MRTKKTTLKDIAAEVGVSITIVSGVLNGRPVRVSEEKRKEIVRVAKARNYLPNRIARSLVSQRSKTLGLVIPSIESRAYTSYTKHLEELCRKAGYALFITNTNDRFNLDIQNIEQLVERGVDGIFFVPSNEAYERSEEIISLLEGLPIPYVMVNRFFVNYMCDRVIFDSEHGGYEATAYLLENGHRKICCVMNTRNSNTGRARFRGYLEAIESFGLRVDPNYVIESPWTMSGGYEAGLKIMRTDATAILAGSNYVALGLRKALDEAGKRLPEDYSLVSFDESESDFLLGAPATTIIQDNSKLAKSSFELMERRLSGDQSEPVAISVDVVLRPGETVAPLAGAAE